MIPLSGAMRADDAVTDAHELVVEAEVRQEDDGPGHRRPRPGYCCRRCQRVRFRSFLCFFFRIFLRRFLTTDGKGEFESVVTHGVRGPANDRGQRAGGLPRV